MKTLFVSVFAIASVWAQETPTERDAARGVVVKMAELEKSLDVPTIVERLSASNIARDQVAARAKELMDKELLAMADDITRHPEIGFEEYKSIEKLTSYLNHHGFKVTMGAGGLKTAFVARYRRKDAAPNLSSPSLGVILEYDALRGTTRAFHGDQHSAQGPVGVAGAMAIARASGARAR